MKLASTPISPFISHPMSPPLSPCSCRHCMGTDDLGVQIPPLQSAKYLGAYVAANASSAPDCSYRCSQAIGAFRSLCPVFTIRPSPRAVNCRCMRELCLPSSSMGVDLKFLPLRGSQGSILFTIRFCDKSFKLKALTTIESFTPLRRTVPMILALPRLLSCPLLIPSQRISVQRLRYLGHLLRHFEALEHRTSGASLLHSVLVDSQKLFTVLSNLEEISIPPPKKFPIQCTPRALSPWFTYILDLPSQTGMIPLRSGLRSPQ